MIKPVILLAFLFTATSCIPAAVVGGMYAHSKLKQARQQFRMNFQAINSQREADGLKLLDWCEEALKFDRKWAVRKEGCVDPNPPKKPTIVSRRK